MRKLLLTPVLIIIAALLSSCSSADKCSENGNYNIEYYSGGGFTGIVKGIIVKCDGSAVTWIRKPGQSREYIDSLKLSDTQIKTLNKMIADPALFKYENSYTGNYTTHLNILKNNRINKISYNGAEIPDGMPDAVRNLIAEIKSIYKQ